MELPATGAGGQTKQPQTPEKPSRLSQEASYQMLSGLTAIRKKLEAYGDRHPGAKQNIKTALEVVGVVVTAVRYAYAASAGAVGGYVKDGEAGAKQGAAAAMQAFAAFQGVMAAGKDAVLDEARGFGASLGKTPEEKREFAKTSVMGVELLGMALGLKGAKKGGTSKSGAPHARKTNISKAESSVWKNLNSYRGEYKTDGKKVYKWDHTHNDIEVFSKNNRKHLGSMDPTTGEMYKPGVPGREGGF